MNKILVIASGLLLAVYGRELKSQDDLDFKINKHESKERIVGGTEAGNHSRPWMVYVSTTTSMCGGALIRPQWVLTAAHCANQVNKTHKVVAGTNKICVVINNETFSQFGDGAEERSVLFTFIKSYDSATQKNDIALLKLDRPFPINENIQTIALASRQYSPGEMLEASGWGDTSAVIREYGCLLRSVELPVVAKPDCVKVYGNVFDKEFCAGYEDGQKDICDGDSGGPLIDLSGDSPALVGIVGSGSPNCNTYSIFINVQFYSDFINENINRLG